MNEVDNTEVIEEQKKYQNQIEQNNLSKEEMMTLRKSDQLYVSEKLAEKEENHKKLKEKLTKTKEDYTQNTIILKKISTKRLEI